MPSRVHPLVHARPSVCSDQQHAADRSTGDTLLRAETHEPQIWHILASPLPSPAEGTMPGRAPPPLHRERWGTLTACRRARCQTVSEALHFHIYPRRIVTRCNNPLESQRPRLGDFIGPLTWTTKFFREDISRDRQFRQVVFSI